MDVIYLSRFGSCCGVSTYTEQLAQAVANAKLEVSALASDHSEKGNVCRDAIPNVPSIVSWSEQGAIRKVLSEVLEQRPRVIHIQHEFGIFRDTEGLYNLCIEIRRRSPETKLVLTAHTVPPGVKSHKDAFIRLICEVDAVIVHSHLARTVMVRYPGANNIKHLQVIPHGMIGPVERVSREKAEQELGIEPKDNRFTLLSLGFMTRNKKHVMLSHLIAAIVQRRMIAPKEILLIIAGMPTIDEEGCRLLNSLKLTIERLKIKDHVRLIPEFIPFEKLPIYYGAADIAVHMCEHSFHSSSGSVRMDLAYGMPVLVQKAELTQDLPPGVVQFFNRPNDLLTQLPVLAKQPARLRAMSAGAHNMAERNSWRKTAAIHTALYRQLAGKDLGDPGGSVRAAIFHSCGSLLGGKF